MQVLGSLRDDATREYVTCNRGSSTVNVEPLPSPSLAANTRPPCCLTIDRTMYKPEAGALDLEAVRLETVEAMKYALELSAGDTDAAVADSHPDRLRRWCRDLDRDLHCVARILDRVVEQVGEDRAQLVGVAVDEQPAAGERRRHSDHYGVGRQVMTEPARSRDTSPGERGDVDGRAVLEREPLAGYSGLEHLLDGLFAAARCRRASRDRTLAVARRRPRAPAAFRETSRIDAIGVLSSWVTALMNASCCVVATDLAHQEHGVDNDAGDDERKRQDPEHERQHPPRVDDDPADVEGDRRGDQDRRRARR